MCLLKTYVNKLNIEISVTNVAPAPTNEVTVKEENPVNVQQQKDVKGKGKEKPEIPELPLDDTWW